MKSTEIIQNKELYKKIRVISNSLRFRILELTQNKQLTITELSSHLKLSYTKCADYIRMLEEHNLITKTKSGKEVKISSNTTITKNEILFKK